jgi:hypothetical protein
MLRHAVFFLTLALALVGAGQSKADDWLPKPFRNTPFDPSTWKLPPEYHTQFVGHSHVTLNVRIYRDDRLDGWKAISYSIDGKAMAPLPIHHYATHSRTYLVGGGSGPARMLIRFHNGGYDSRGNQIIREYVLDGGNYEFEPAGAFIDLFKK